MSATYEELRIGFDLLPDSCTLDDGTTIFYKNALFKVTLGDAANDEEFGGIDRIIRDNAVAAVAAAGYYERDYAEAVLYLRDKMPDTPIYLIGELVDCAEYTERFILLNPGISTDQEVM